MTISSVAKRLAFLALATLGAGCTYGAVVDGNFELLSDKHPELTSDVPLSFIRLGTDLRPTSEMHSFWLEGQSYVSFDYAAADGATAATFPGMKNVHQAIPEGNYYILLDTAPIPGAPVYRSLAFAHGYDGGCTDGITGQADQYCAEYLFQISDCTVSSPTPTGPMAPPQPLSTHNGIKVIPLCRII